MSWWKKVSKWLGMITVRNRDARGRYVADDLSTPDKDEAYTKVYKTAKGAFKKTKAKKKITLSAKQKVAIKKTSKKKPTK
jgi:hypothetical protein